MKIVFDTNVFIAAFITRGASTEVFEHCLLEHSIYLSDFILEELSEKLLKKFKFPKEKVESVIDFLKNRGKMITPSPLEKRTCRDPDDDHILATAQAVRADCLITGDEDLLVLRTFHGIPIFRPSHFWEFEARK